MIRVLLKILCVFWAGITFPVSPVMAAENDLGPYPFTYQQDFETSDPFELWVSNGSYSIHSKGLTTDASRPGKRIFRLDVTLETAKYLYFMIPVRVPCAGNLSFSGKIRIVQNDGASASLGMEAVMPYTGLSGVITLDRLQKPSDSWITQSANVVESGKKTAQGVLNLLAGGAAIHDVGIIVDKVVLFLWAEKGGRITVCVDAISMDGKVPDLKAYDAISKSKWDNYLGCVTTNLKVLNTEIAGISGKLTRDDDRAYASNAIKDATAILRRSESRGFPTGEDYHKLGYYRETLGRLQSDEESATLPHSDAIALYPWQPITPERILPETYPLAVPRGNAIKVKAAPGEYEPFSFVIRALRDLRSIKMVSTRVAGPDGISLPSDTLDLRLVKAWYRSGDGTIFNQGIRVLVPGLLLKDDSLVRVDEHDQKNYLRVIVNGKPEYADISASVQRFPPSAVVRDSEKLESFCLSASKNKQVWGTLHISEDAKPGLYNGRIEITVGDIPYATVDLTVEVLDIRLQPPVVEYALYYTGQLKTVGPFEFGSRLKSAEQYEKEMANIFAHGVSYPTIYEGGGFLKKALEVRKSVGLPSNHLYQLDGTGVINTKKQLADMKSRLRDVLRLSHGQGYGDVYIHTIDEAQGPQLESERPIMQAIHDIGGKSFVACFDDALDIVGDLLDRPILSGPFKPDIVAKWHKLGKRVFIYGNPQTGIENPALYRKNYGIGMWCAGYDGAMPFAYQHAFGSIWNDFDHPEYRDHVFSYPTSDGIIDTLQWEGFREGVDDMRYLSTLLESGKISAISLKSLLCPQIEQGKDLDQIRRQIVEKILE